ncbi:MAG: two-component system, OmpR family, sensor kinase [Thermomicrobiales bacterium]|nr:two-component system, OmpR family, sensor kinase [Thermomicrobiales bacterium]
MNTAPPVRRRRRLPWPIRQLRFLLIWPLVSAWRRKTRRSLRWRLAASHFAVVLYSVFAIAAVGIAAMMILAVIQVPTENEAAAEASVIAKSFERLATRAPLTDADRSSLLRAMATGEIAPNVNQSNVSVYASVGRVLGNVEAISIVDRSGRIVASSDQGLIGQSIEAAGPLAAAVGERALAGSTDLLRNSEIDSATKAPTGAYPLHGSNDQLVGAVVLEKTKRTFTPGLPLWVLAAQFVGVIGLVVLALVGIPAIPIGIVTGIRRARAVSRPVAMLAATADRFARGDLSARVEVKGQDEVASLQHSFNAMAEHLQGALAREAAQRERAEQALAANRELVANVSHELRTPVALVRAHLEALAGEPERGEDYVRIALRETDRLEHLVEDLFALTRLESQGLSLSFEPFDAGSVVREAIESLADPARRETGLTLVAEVEPGELTTVGDRARVVQVIQNLIRNAIRFTPEGGIILAGANRDGDAVAITVRDTGVGIAPEDVPHVFDRFYRVERSRNRGSGGAGLGLTIARQLVESMGGTITVESTVDEGTTFTIRLPRSVKPAPVAANGANSHRAPVVHGGS